MSLTVVAFHDSVVAMCLPGDKPSGHFLDCLGSCRFPPGQESSLRMGREELQTKRHKNTWGEFWSPEMQWCWEKNMGERNTSARSKARRGTSSKGSKWKKNPEE